MVEFDYTFISVLFGVAGTFILLFYNILSYKKKLSNERKHSLVSQMIGYLFLFDSFIYLLWPKISSEFYSVPAISTFHYWPYYLFILAGIIISLYLVKEKDFGWGSEVSINPESQLEFWIFYSPAVLAFLALILNTDFLPLVNLFVWFWLMGLVWKKD